MWPRGMFGERCALALALLAACFVNAHGTTGDAGDAQGQAPEMLVTLPAERLWPDGAIPYELDLSLASDEVRERLRAKIAEAVGTWNDETVLDLHESPSSTPNVLIRFDPDVQHCWAHAGLNLPRWRAFGLELWRTQNEIVLNAECGVDTIIHEIGHTVGLLHEHQRKDRGGFLHLRPETIEAIYRGDYGPTDEILERAFGATEDSVDGSPYDYRSAQHYDAGFFTTVPRGIAIVQGSATSWVSPGDADGVNRIYGSPTPFATVTTNPPRLEIVVDGTRVATPATLTAGPHVLEAPLVQHTGTVETGGSFDRVERNRYLFGNWGGSGTPAAGQSAATINVTVDEDRTWFQANFIEQPWDGKEYASPWVDEPPCTVSNQQCWLDRWYTHSVEHYADTIAIWPRALTFAGTQDGLAEGSRRLHLTVLEDAEPFYTYTVRAEGDVRLGSLARLGGVRDLSPTDDHIYDVEPGETVEIVVRMEQGLEAGRHEAAMTFCQLPTPPLREKCVEVPVAANVLDDEDSQSPTTVSVWPDSLRAYAAVFADRADKLAAAAAQSTSRSSVAEGWREDYNRLIAEIGDLFRQDALIQALEDVAARTYYFNEDDEGAVAGEAARAAAGLAVYMRSGVAAEAIAHRAAALAAAASGSRLDHAVAESWRLDYNRLVREARGALADDAFVAVLEELAAREYYFNLADGTAVAGEAARGAAGLAVYMRSGDAAEAIAHRAAALDLAASERPEDRAVAEGWRQDYNRLVREARGALAADAFVAVLEEVAHREYYFNEDDEGAVAGEAARAAAGLAVYMRSGVAAEAIAHRAAALAAAASGSRLDHAVAESWRLDYNRLVREARGALADDAFVAVLEELAAREYYFNLADGTAVAGEAARGAAGLAVYMRSGDAAEAIAHRAAALDLAASERPEDRAVAEGWRQDYNRLVREARGALAADAFVAVLEEVAHREYYFNEDDEGAVAGEAARAAAGLAVYMRSGVAAEAIAHRAAALAAAASGSRADNAVAESWRLDYNRLAREARDYFVGDVFIQSLQELEENSSASATADAVSNAASTLEGIVLLTSEVSRPADGSHSSESVYATWQARSGDTLVDCLGCPSLIVVPAGTFEMGSPEDESGRDSDEGPVHSVALQAPFAVGQYEITLRQYRQFVSSSGYQSRWSGCWVWEESEWQYEQDMSWQQPSFEQTDDHPVVCVSWDDAKAYTRWLSAKTGSRYRLLTEAEWEYAARAGTTTRYHFGDVITAARANYTNRLGGTVAVGSFGANAFGLYDMHGNAAERVQDCWRDSYDRAPIAGQPMGAGFGDCSRRIYRGGSWGYAPSSLRSAARSWSGSDFKNPYTGFRVARMLVGDPVGLSSEHLVPVFVGSADLDRQSFVRITNQSQVDGPIWIHAINDATGDSEFTSLFVSAGSSTHINSEDLERGNPKKGLARGIGTGSGDWRLEVYTELDIHVTAYMRTRDGFLTAMHDVVPRDGSRYRVATFNPASNANQVSYVRLINPGWNDITVSITGLDDAGVAGRDVVKVNVPPRATRTLSAADLESGRGVVGALGNGAGKWHLTVRASQPLRVMSLMSSPTGHLTNLSTIPAGFEELPDGRRLHRIPLFFAQADDGRHGFMRIANRDGVAGAFTLDVYDDLGQHYGSLDLSLAGYQTRHINSRDLEQGSDRKGIPVGIGRGTGDWRIEVRSALDLEVLSFARTADGFLTALHDTVAGIEDEGRHRYEVPTFNPGSNTNQRSNLRLVNYSRYDTTVSIVGIDNAGFSPGRTVRVTVPAGAAKTISAADLESGNGLSGALGDGSGKWRLVVTSNRPLQVLSLLTSATGHVTNLSTLPRTGTVRE